MQPRFLYLHGFGSGPGSTKAVAIAAHYAARGICFDRPDLQVPSRERQRLGSRHPAALSPDPSATVNGPMPPPPHASDDTTRRAASTEEADAVAAIRAGDQAAFAELGQRYRRQLHVHCYRMLGSFDDAEDLVQETLLRAWRGREGFEGRSRFRTWLYRIATNACLNALERAPRRVLPQDVAPPVTAATDASEARSTPAWAPEVPWLQPYPDSLLDLAAPSEREPDALLASHETIALVFLAALQHLPPRQRAILILCDVLGWSAAEAAESLELSVAAVNSALQRAHATMRAQLPEGTPRPAGTTPTDDERAALGAFMVISADGTPIAFDQVGRGAPIIFVVGAFNDRSTGAPLAAALAAQFQVYSYDRRGRGDSGDTAPYAIDREVEDLAALIARAGGSASLFGFSSGAALALSAAARGLPVTRLALFDLPLRADGPLGQARRVGPLAGDHAATLRSLIAAGHRGDAVEYFQARVVGLPEAIVAGLRHAPFRPALEAMAHTLIYDVTLMGDGELSLDLARQVHIPTLAIAGGAGFPFMRETAEALACALPDGAALTLDGLTHDLEPTALAPVLARFYGVTRR